MTSSPDRSPVTLQPPREAFHIERVIDPFTGEEAIGQVRHPGQPWRWPGGAPPRRTESAAWQCVGIAYLKWLAQVLALEPGQSGWVCPQVWEALMGSRAERLAGRKLGFAWLDISWSEPDMAGSTETPRPLGSFWVDTAAAPGEADRPRTLVLLAGNVQQDYRLVLGSDVGLRIALHVSAAEVRVHGVTLSGLCGPRAVQALVPVKDENLPRLLSVLASRLREPLQHYFVWINGLETPWEPGPPPNRLRISASGLRARSLATASAAAGLHGRPKTRQEAHALRASRVRVHDICVDVDWHEEQGELTVVKVLRNEHVGSEARASWRRFDAFLSDPASQGTAATSSQRRPTRSERQLKALQRPVQLNLEGEGMLRFVDGDPLFETRVARRYLQPGQRAGTVRDKDGVAVLGQALPAANPGAAKGGDEPSLFTDEQGSLETHVRASELFDRMRGYHFDPHLYFRFARLPLVQRARPSMRWAPDGELPNAEVRPFLEAEQGLGAEPPRASDRVQLLIKYGSADPMHRRKMPLADIGGAAAGTAACRVAQYLSVASDPRWAWHEFGHVLNFASTGELEFPFAHSAGDALGAIAADPMSGLAPDDDPESPARFVTFPWIEVPGRSHGRSARKGYCWCGQRNLVRLDFSARMERYQHSYFGEQLLSSSLFRLYRSLGGDTRRPKGARADTKARLADEEVRLSASDYCIYLIMRAIGLLGPDSVAPARTVDQFVSALIDADLGTGAWDVSAHWPFDRDPRRVRRQGGRAHKVIRWAFERQGLYATDNPREVAEGCGKPPAVDIFIADQRAINPEDDDRGAYAPVPLRWPDDSEPANVCWHANPGSISRHAEHITVKVENRGHLDAAEVGLRFWLGSDDGRGVRWEAASESPRFGVPGNGASVVELALPAARLKGKTWLMLSADATADPSNLPGPKPPSDRDELVQLVACDNNLGLLKL